MGQVDFVLPLGMQTRSIFPGCEGIHGHKKMNNRVYFWSLTPDADAFHNVGDNSESDQIF